MEIYNQEYYQRHLVYSGTEKEIRLNEFRRDLLLIGAEKYDQDLATIVDYGCSHGAFIEAIKGISEDAVGVDINPFCAAHCVKNGIKALSPDMFSYFYKGTEISIMTFWDVLEHLPCPSDILTTFKPNVICLSMPCLDAWLEASPNKSIQLWKHWRPLEHLWNFTLDQLVEFLSLHGYETVYSTFDESKIRTDVVLKDKNIMSLVALKKP
jgi:hypothetical protein